MLKIIQGVPGSGKSYYAVHYITKYFCIYDDVYGYILDKDVVIITNLDDFKLNHLKLDDCINKYKDFFTVSNFEKLKSSYRNKHIILVIDEAQRYFPLNYNDKEALFFFQYHRHLGIDILLITQSINSISKLLLPLCESIISATPRSTKIFNLFRYHEYLYFRGKLEKVHTFSIKTNPKIFNLYKSFNFDVV